MRNRYWGMYTTIKHKEQYYKHFLIRSKRINGMLVGICAAISTICATSWFIWDFLPGLLASLIIVVQVFQVLSPHLPFNKQIVSLTFLLPQITALLLDIDREWLNIDDYDEQQIKGLIAVFEKRYYDLSNQFSNDVYSPMVRPCDKRAQADCNTYFYHQYGTREDAANVK